MRLLTVYLPIHVLTGRAATWGAAHLSTRFAYGARYYVCAEAIDADELIRRERTARGGRVLVGDEE